MKIIQVVRELKFEAGGAAPKTFEEGSFYIMSNKLQERISTFDNRIFGMEIPFHIMYTEYDGEDLNDKKILMLRHGGGGDILFMLTGIKELKRIYPRAQFGIAIGHQYKELVDPTLVNNIYELPLKLDVWNTYHYHMIFENIIENNPLAASLNAYDLFLNAMKLDPKKVLPENKIPAIKPVMSWEKENMLASAEMLNDPAKKIGIQVATSAPVRNYPAYNLSLIAIDLIKKGYQVYLFGSVNQSNIMGSIKDMAPEVFVVMESDLRNSIIIASLMDCFIAPDSMFIHIAGALNIPVIGLYGPFASELRMKYFKNSIGIDVDCGCSPCFIHGHHPCPKGSPSPCFSMISVDLVMEAFEKKIEQELWKGV